MSSVGLAHGPGSTNAAGHRNSYRAGVRDGNWVEELAAKEILSSRSPSQATALSAQQTTAAQVHHTSVGAPSQSGPKRDETFEMMFSHGVDFGEKYQASMYRLHYTDPRQRERGSSSRNRVHNTFYYGNKFIDSKVPATDPNLPTSLVEQKRRQWAAESQPISPVDDKRWMTTSKAFGM